MGGFLDELIIDLSKVVKTLAKDAVTKLALLLTEDVCQDKWAKWLQM